MTTTQRPLSSHIKQCLTERARGINERCGFIMNSADPATDVYILDIPNIHPRPDHNFAMDPAHQQLAFADEENIVGIWHTHPSGPDGPSDYDLKVQFPGLRHWVATRNGVFEYGSEA